MTMRFSSFAIFKLGAFWLFGGFRIASCVFRGLLAFMIWFRLGLAVLGFGECRLWQNVQKAARQRRYQKPRVFEGRVLGCGRNSEKTAKDCKNIGFYSKNTCISSKIKGKSKTI